MSVISAESFNQLYNSYASIETVLNVVAKRLYEEARTQTGTSLVDGHLIVEMDALLLLEDINNGNPLSYTPEAVLEIIQGAYDQGSGWSVSYVYADKEYLPYYCFTQLQRCV